jgi:acyl-CoA synthetase (AMP-forming)/AMP-acid ligase II
LPELDLAGDTVLSVLPWSHAFGLVLDLLAGLLGGAGSIVREPSGGRDPASIVRWAHACDADRLNAVPLTIARIAQLPGGGDVLGRLRGGIVGGAPATADLIPTLVRTNLRPGYGQTEASPGITLGQPGDWIPGALGSPIGCRVRIDDAGQLLVNGPNTCLGRWTPGVGLAQAEPGRWMPTGDLVERTERGLRFLDRLDDAFKLANGRLVVPSELEAAIERELNPSAALSDAATAPVRAVVVPEGGESIGVWLLGLHRRVTPTDIRGVERALGPLARRLAGVRRLRQADLPLTRKGAIDRRALRTLDATPPRRSTRR